jgi:hypothetical protein
MKSFFASRIPKLIRIKTVSEADIADAQNRGPLHLFGVGTDMAWGSWGSRIPCITISTRTSLNVLQAQEAGDILAAPFWALFLGWALESIDPGHLQGAMVADTARAIAAYRYITGLKEVAS